MGPCAGRGCRFSGHENGARRLLFWSWPLGSGDRDRGFWENACWAGRFLDDGRSSPSFSLAAPATCPVALRARIRRCRLPTASPTCRAEVKEALVRSVGLDVHLDFCQVALVEDGELRSAGPIKTTPEQIAL